MDPHVKVSFECFAAEWTSIKRNYFGYKKWIPPNSIFDLPTPIYEGDDFETTEEGKTKNQTINSIFIDYHEKDEQNQEEKLMATFLQPYSKKTVQNNRLKRASIQTFNLFPIL